MTPRTKFITVIDWRPGYIDLSNSNFAVAVVAESNDGKGPRRIYKVTFKLDSSIKFVVVVNASDGGSTSLPSPDECVLIQAYKKIEEREDVPKVRPVIQVVRKPLRPKKQLVYIKPLIIDKSQRHEIVANEIIYYWIGIEYDVALAARYGDWPFVRYL